jgi:surface antigen
MLLLAFATLASATTAVAQPVYADQSTSSVGSATRQLNQAVNNLNNLNNVVEISQAQLDVANKKLDADKIAQAKLDKELASLARYEYEQPGLMMRMFAAGSLSQAFAEINEAQIVAHRQQALHEKAVQLRVEDQKARDSAAAYAKAIEDARRQAAEVAAEAQAALTAATAEAVRQQAAQVSAMAMSIHAYSASASVGNHFSTGYCTWYVANRRPIPWFGNAIEWFGNARAYGFPEGSAPAVGAVMVTRESSAGHVAYVESVNADGSWTVSEMNYVGWGVVSRRTIHRGQVPVIGFIYG